MQSKPTHLLQKGGPAQCRQKKLSNARYGSTAPFRRSARHFRSSPLTGHIQCQLACLETTGRRPLCHGRGSLVICGHAKSKVDQYANPAR
jgi:hypothetical protein